MSSAATTVVTIRWARKTDEPRLVEVDEATWSPLVSPAPRPAEPVFFRPHLEVDDQLLARRLYR